MSLFFKSAQRFFKQMHSLTSKVRIIVTCLFAFVALGPVAASALDVSPSVSQDGVIHASWDTPNDFSFASEFTSNVLSVKQNGTSLFTVSMSGSTNRQLVSGVNDGDYQLVLDVCGTLSSGANQCHQQTADFSILLDSGITPSIEIVASENEATPSSFAAEMIGVNQVEISWNFLGFDAVQFVNIPSSVESGKCSWSGNGSEHPDATIPTKDQYCPQGTAIFSDPEWEGKEYGVRPCNHAAECVSSAGCEFPKSATYVVNTSCYAQSTRYMKVADSVFNITNLPPLVSFNQSYTAQPGQTIAVQVHASDFDAFNIPNLSEGVQTVKLYLAEEADLGQFVNSLEPIATATTGSNGTYSFNVAVNGYDDLYLIAVAEDALGATAYATSYIRISDAGVTPPANINNNDPIDFSDYKIYFGDVDGENGRDVYFHGITKFVLLHGDIITPIALPTATGFIFYGDGQGGYVQSEPMDLTHAAVDARIAAGDFLLADDSQLTSGDINGDGHQDLLVRSPDANGSSIIVEGTDGDDLPQLLVEILETGQTRAPGQEPSELPQFVNNLNDQSISMSSSGLNLDGRTLSLATLQQTANSEGAVQASDENISAAPVASLPQPSLSAGQVAEMDTLIGLGGSFRVNEMGAATYSIPIKLPAGTAGVAPPVSVNYSSQNQLGNMGLGWQLSAGGGISRCRQTLQVDKNTQPISFSKSDRLCLNGQRLLRVTEDSDWNSDTKYWQAGTEYRTEVDSDVLVKLEITGSHYKFKVYGKDGSTSIYGGNSLSRRHGYTDTGVAATDKVMSWNLSEFSDSAGNTITYVYEQHQDYYRIGSITYANGKVVVDFEYGPKQHTYNSWVTGYNFKDSSLLTEISVNDSGHLLHSYTFDYDADIPVNPGDQIDRLANVSMCKGDYCTLPMSFEWGRSYPQDAFWALEHSLTSASNSLPTVGAAQSRIDLPDGYNYISHVPVDFNGDAIPDMSVLTSINGENDFYVRNYLQNESGTYGYVNRTLIHQNSINFKEIPQLLPVDLNADGRGDLVIYNAEAKNWRVAFAEPISANIWQIGSRSTAFLSHITGLPEDIRFADLNSDGLADLLYVKDNNFKAHYLKRNSNANSSSTAYSYDAASDITVSAPGLNLKYFGGIVDINQDGKVDIVALSTDKSVQNVDDNFEWINWDCEYNIGLSFLISGANGTFQYGSESLIENGSSPQSNTSSPVNCDKEISEYVGLTPPQLADINNDGLTDIVVGYSDKFYQYVNGKRTHKFEELKFRLGKPDNSFGVEGTYQIQNSDTVLGFQLMDWKHDNTIDLVLDLKDNKKRYAPWTGSNFQTNTVNLIDADTSRQAQIGDTNGDGVLDITTIKDNEISISKGNRISLDLITAFTSSLGAKTKIQYEPLNRSGSYKRVGGLSTETRYRTGCTLFENAQGQTSVSAPPVAGFACVETEQLPYRVITTDGFYELINNPFGEEDSGSSLYAPLSGENANIGLTVNGPAQDFLTGMAVVTAVGSTAPTAEDSNALAVVEYAYEGLKIQAGGRGMLGFEALTTTDRQTGVSTETRYRQDWPFTGTPKQTTVKTSTGKLLSESFSSMRIYIADPLESIKQKIADHGSGKLGSLVVYNAISTERAYDVAAEHLLMPAQLGSPAPTEVQVLLKQVDISNEVDAWNNNVTSVVQTHGFDGSSMVLEEEKTTKSQYFNDLDLSTARLGRLAWSEVETYRRKAQGLDRITRTANFTYYGYPGCENSTAANKGLLCTEQVTVSDTASSLAPATTWHYYDNFGNKTHTKTGDRVSAYGEYDEDGRYVVRTFDVFSSLSKEQASTPSTGSYNAPAGAVSVMTSEVITRSEHGIPLLTRSYLGDGNYVYANAAVSPLGVAYFKGGSNGAWEQNYTTRVGTGHPDACPVNTAIVSFSEAAGGASSGSCHDKAGQSIGSFKVAFDGRLIRSVAQLDTLGRAVATSEPSYASNPELFTYTNFDVLGRPASMVHPVLVTKASGEETNTNVRTSVSYVGFTTTTISSGVDSVDKIKTEVKDVLGQLESVTEQGSRSAYYDYDVLGNLVKLTDELGNESTISYNGLGQKIEMDDPDKGFWRYEYNEYGELDKQIDAKNQATVIEYDFKGRKLLSKTYTDVNNPELVQTWDYDRAANGLGQVSRARDYSLHDNVAIDANSGVVSGNKAWTTKQTVFDHLGRPEQTVTTLQGPNGEERFYQKQSYDQYGRAYQSFDAARIGPQYKYNGIQNVYNQYGYLSKVVDAANDGSGAMVYKVNGMDARGNVTQMLYGDGNTVNYYYHHRTGFLESIWRVGALASNQQDYQAKWDHLGNLVSREDKLFGGSDSKLETFSYDQYNRLVSNTIGSSSVDVSYNKIDNILSKSDQQNGATYEYHTTKVHAVTKVGNRVLEYDANGNAKKDGSKDIIYSVKDQALQIKTPSHVTEFSYAFGSRYKRVDAGAGGTTTTLYIGSVEKVYNADGSVVWKRNIGGKAQIMHTQSASGLSAGTRSYFFHDHLGSVVAISNSIGQIQQRMAYDPWGKRRKLESGKWTKDKMEHGDVLASFAKTAKPITNAGFTGHEMLDEVDIIHMNGRIYDASLGRFLQADPMIQAPTMIGSLNRYSYTMNNPLNAVDPSGYSWISKKWKQIRHDVEKVVIAAVVIGLSVATYGAASSWAVGVYGAGCTVMCSVTTAGFIGGAVGGAAAGFVAGASIAAFSGASFENSIKAGAKGAVTGAISGGFGGWAGGISAGSTGGVASKLALSATGGCLAGVASGGNCDTGAEKALLAAALAISIEMLAEHAPTYKTPDDGRAVYKMDDKSITRVVCPECDVPSELVNNIGSATKVGSENAHLVGTYVPSSKLGWMSEGAWGSRALSKVPGFNSGGVVHDRFVGTLERATKISTLTGWQRTIPSLFTNKATIFPVIGVNYYALGVGNLEYYDRNIAKSY